MVRRAPALSELEALTVVLTYLANDLGSVERDRRGGGPDQEPNLVLHLERYFLASAQARVSACFSADNPCYFSRNNISAHEVRALARAPPRCSPGKEIA